MRRRPTILLFAAAALMFLAQVAISYATRNPGHATSSLDAKDLPLTLKDWKGSDIDLDERVFRQLGAVSAVNRDYVGPNHARIQLNVAAFDLVDASVPHPPPLCYRSAGWTIQKQASLNLENGSCRQLQVESGANRAVIAYWYQVGDKIALNRNDLRRILHALRKKKSTWPPIVKVLLHTDAMDVESSEDNLREIGSQIYDWVRQNSKS